MSQTGWLSILYPIGFDLLPDQQIMSLTRQIAQIKPKIPPLRKLKSSSPAYDRAQPVALFQNKVQKPCNHHQAQTIEQPLNKVTTLDNMPNKIE